MSQEKIEQIRERCRQDPLFLAKEVLGYKDLREVPHREVTDLLEAPDKTKKLVLMPRGSFKSSLVTVAYSIYSMIRDPNIRIMISCETQNNSRFYVGEIRSHFENNPKFKALFGNWKNKDQAWRDDMLTIKPRTRIIKEPTLRAVSLEKMATTGYHADLIIADDVVSPLNVNTPEQIQKTIDHYKLLLSILDPGKKMVVVGTRWNVSDLYGWIQDPNSGECEQFDTIVKQAEYPDGTLLLPHRLTKDFLDKARLTQGPYLYSCNPGEAPILMSDWTTRRIDQIRVGDEVVGFQRGTADKRAVICKSTVLEVFSREADVVKVTLENGHTIRCTPDHQWYTGRVDDTHASYLPAKVGRRMVQVLDLNTSPTQEQIADYRYLAGLIDGEGNCKISTILIAQSETHNPAVCQAIRDVTSRLGILCQEYRPRGGRCVQFALNGGRTVKHRVLQYGKPAKKDQIVESIWKRKGTLGSRDAGRPKVVSIEADGRETVYSFRTTTGNYVAWGYASKNCNYLNNPIAAENQTFQADWVKFYETPPKGLVYFMTLDPALSEDKMADYTAIVVNGVDSKNNWYIQEAIAVRTRPSETVELVFQLAKKYQPLMCLGMERFALERLLKLTLIEEMQKRGEYIPIKEIPTDTRVSKEIRIRALQPKMNAGQIYLKKTHDALYQQIVMHPQCKYDDLLDALKSQLAVSFPSDYQDTEEPPKDYSALPPRDRKEWEHVKKMRKVRQTNSYDF